MRTYWLSFCDVDKPDGQQFLGVAVVEVTEADAAVAKRFIDLKFPQHEAGAEWTAAALRKAHVSGCNPGGQVAFMEVDVSKLPPALPRGQLLQRAELEAMGLAGDRE